MSGSTQKAMIGFSAAALALMPVAGDAQSYRGGPPNFEGRSGYYQRSGYGYAPDPNESRGYYYNDRHPYRARRHRCQPGSGGTILGAIAGGLLGNAAVGHRGDGAAGALVGAGGGALVGNAVSRDCG